MLQLKNKTAFAAELSIFPDQHGVDTLFVIVRASFVIGSDDEPWFLCKPQQAAIKADVYREEPVTSSLLYSSDIHTGKPCTDIAVLGCAVSPGLKPVQQLGVDVSVGTLSKNISVFGQRQWQNGFPSSPASFTTMPIIYENAFGGSYSSKTKGSVAHPDNPIGTGFKGSRSAREMDGLAVPSIEDPNSLIQTVDDSPVPAGLGFVSPNWSHRIKYAGTYDEKWQRQRAPYLPEDFDSRFLNSAHPDLVYAGYLTGDEQVSISNMNENGDLNFTLPDVRLAGLVEFKGNSKTLDFNLETLILEPNDRIVRQQWRSQVAAPKSASMIKQVEIDYV